MDRRGAVETVRVFYRRAHPGDKPGRTCAAAGPIPDTRNVDRTAEQRGRNSNSLQREETAVAESPDTDPVRIYIRQRLKVVGARRHIEVILASKIHVVAGCPLAVVAGASTIIGSQDDISLLGQVLVHRVV